MPVASERLIANGKEDAVFYTSGAGGAIAIVCERTVCLQTATD